MARAKEVGPPSLQLARAEGFRRMRELHESPAQDKGNPDTGNSEITSSVPSNSELLEFSLPPRREPPIGPEGDIYNQPANWTPLGSEASTIG